MLKIRCSGTPYEIGQQHGTVARNQVSGSIAFYKDLFQQTCAMDWVQVQSEAAKFRPMLEIRYPRLIEEMRGLADAAGCDFLDVLALNVRTEIAFGLFTADATIAIKTDGCTSIACRSSTGKIILSQNWDWQVEQTENLVICQVSQVDKPEFTMITEAGVIGKIGWNSDRVGVCLNAIRAKGTDTSKLPIHLAMRIALEATSAAAAVEELQSLGTAGSGHILIADEDVAFGVECTSLGVKLIKMSDDINGSIVHANHLILDHPHVEEPPWLPDSPERMKRMEYLLQQQLDTSQGLGVNASTVFRLFQDEDGYPGAINRCQVGLSETQTLFNIVMDFGAEESVITFGRLIEGSERMRFRMGEHLVE